MVYVGGILVLLIFGIMLTQKVVRQSEQEIHNKVEVLTSRGLAGFLIGSGMFLFLGYIIIDARFKMQGEVINTNSTIRTIGVELMTSHLLPFEIAAILLLVALVGAAYLALNRNPA